MSVGMQTWDRSIHFYENGPHGQSGPVTRTGPNPIFRGFHELSADGVVVDILDGVVDGLRFVEIMVVARTDLPKVAVDTVPVAYGEPFQER